jgi:MarR family transcriptional regulator, organic hydroperoxide resistance regulator
MAPDTDISDRTDESAGVDCTGEPDVAAGCIGELDGAGCDGEPGGPPARALTCENWPRSTPLAERTGPTVHAVFRLSRMHKTIIGGLLRELGLAPGQELLLLQLWDRDRCSQADLVARLGLDPSTVTKMLQRLERDGWVGREPSPRDRRVMVVTLTPAGRGLQDAVTVLWSELEAQTVKSLDPAERAEFLRLLRKVESGLRASRGAAAHGEPPG